MCTTARGGLKCGRVRAAEPATLMQDSTILTFLFTDIEGSTSKWEEHPEQMAQAVGRHDALLRDAVHASHRTHRQDYGRRDLRCVRPPPRTVLPP